MSSPSPSVDAARSSKPSRRERRLAALLIALAPLSSSAAYPQVDDSSESAAKSWAETVEGAQHLDGFLDLYWDESAGKLFLAVDRFDQELLYVTSLPAGIGSNDIGLDRGQLGDTRVVEFRRIGPRVLLVQLNTRYRAESENPAERRAVEQAFAESVLWGFEVAAEEEGRVLVDATELFLSDVHDVVERLKRAGQGTYGLEASRSAIYLPRTKAFPRNTEVEATLTFTGEPQGGFIRSVSPSADAVTVREHHSFVELPDAGYEPRRFDPRSGFIETSWYDYATPISQPVVQQYAIRHRLEKKDPAAAVSEAVEPIVYYVDPGAPEPIRSALVDGARWWDQAFEAAGYRNAFQVEILPEDADPMDVRYNLIQWVHRSTRGWSYGSSVTDPRTGEIIKGHVTLGSLRVRQDHLIARALVGGFTDGGEAPPELEQMALARLRQLSAHEVGHTIGLVHNYAASVNQRASVMDYPHPTLGFTGGDRVDLSNAYDAGIGEWDARAVLWGYQDFPEGTDEDAALDAIIRETIGQGLLFITDEDARPTGGAHPIAHLWDNGADPTAELENLLAIRDAALSRFGEQNLRPGEPLADLADVLVPLYLLHRYQIEATSKVLGGLRYTYALRGDDQIPTEPIAPADQRRALQGLLVTLSPEVLTLPERVLELLPPYPPGRRRGRESFPSWQGVTFDPLAAAQVAADMTLAQVLHPERASRLIDLAARWGDRGQPGLEEVIDTLLEATVRNDAPAGLAGEVKRVVDQATVRHLIALASTADALPQARGLALVELEGLRDWLADGIDSAPPAEKANRREALRQIELFLEHPEVEERPAPLRAPDGSPIGG
ncbi:MAG TPA: zinc-dependent metalloprotease [Thermoanaerobaculia bacterium]|nr:zinc-dependent metalloprotease [Thermoanaerobaculia bacterium]